jgi:hypothetical protein
LPVPLSPVISSGASLRANFERRVDQPGCLCIAEVVERRYELREPVGAEAAKPLQKRALCAKPAHLRRTCACFRRNVDAAIDAARQVC